LQFQSEHFRVSSNDGRITALTVVFPPLSFETEARIADTQVRMEGRASEEAFTPFERPPSFSGVGLSGGGYLITIFAAPQ
jgi:hypothetical protein